MTLEFPHLFEHRFNQIAIQTTNEWYSYLLAKKKVNNYDLFMFETKT